MQTASGISTSITQKGGILPQNVTFPNPKRKFDGIAQKEIQIDGLRSLSGQFYFALRIARCSFFSPFDVYFDGSHGQ